MTMTTRELADVPDKVGGFILRVNETFCTELEQLCTEAWACHRSSLVVLSTTWQTRVVGFGHETVGASG
jgi:hypothetical protein